MLRSVTIGVSCVTGVINLITIEKNHGGCLMEERCRKCGEVKEVGVTIKHKNGRVKAYECKECASRPNWMLLRDSFLCKPCRELKANKQKV